MYTKKLTIITRESPLAMWQANHVAGKLRSLHKDLETLIVGIKTQADKFLDRSLESFGGKGAFVKELETSILGGHSDLAVHSMKDVTIDLPDELSLPVILKREDIRDVFVSNQFKRFKDLPENARIGTSSLRRKCQLKEIRPDLELIDVRGNVGTRLNKLDEGQYDALILAAAGMIRLGLQDRVRQFLDVNMMMPAIGQGAIGIETRFGDSQTIELIKPLIDVTTQQCVTAERALNRKLNGGCYAPIASYSEIHNGRLFLKALVGSLDGSTIIRSSIERTVSQADELGESLGSDLLSKGADSILQDVINGQSK